MAAKLRLRPRILAAIALLFWTLVCFASESTSGEDGIHVAAKKEGQTITVDVQFNVTATQFQESSSFR